MCPDLSTDTHLICPYKTSDDYALCHKLHPFRKRLNITHLDTFIHGPFEFVSVQGQKLAIMFFRMTGTSFVDVLQCSITQSPALTSLHI